MLGTRDASSGSTARWRGGRAKLSGRRRLHALTALPCPPRHRHRPRLGAVTNMDPTRRRPNRADAGGPPMTS
jgi:hypothetical protein